MKKLQFFIVIWFVAFSSLTYAETPSLLLSIDNQTQKVISVTTDAKVISGAGTSVDKKRYGLGRGKDSSFIGIANLPNAFSETTFLNTVDVSVHPRFGDEHICTLQIETVVKHLVGQNMNSCKLVRATGNCAAIRFDTNLDKCYADLVIK